MQRENSYFKNMDEKEWFRDTVSLNGSKKEKKKMVNMEKIPFIFESLKPLLNSYSCPIILQSSYLYRSGFIYVLFHLIFTITLLYKARNYCNPH